MNKVQRKLYCLVSLISVIMVLLGGRVAYLKICYGKEYNIRSISQLTTVDQIIPYQQGSIFDANEEQLAVSIPVYDVIIEPIILEALTQAQQSDTLTYLSDTLQIPLEQMYRYLEKNADGTRKYSAYYVPIAKKISYETMQEIQAQNLKGVWFEEGQKRIYPQGAFASHVIGFRRGANSWGIENYYQSYLSGKNGRRISQYENGKAIITEYPPKNGNSVFLTLDRNIQKIAEQAVQTAMEQFPSETASIIVMQPYTGEILAMAASNCFNPNEPDKAPENFQKELEQMTSQEQVDYWNTLWRNFNISNTFEPGSIFKPMVMAAAFDEGIITIDSKFYCSGAKQVADRLIHCNRRSGHHEQSLKEALANSCNVAMMDIGEKMGAQLFYRYQKEFGFGEKTGIDLPAEESAQYLLYPPERLGPVELATSSFGQSFNCTPIQAITAFCAVINGGNLMKPHLVSKIVNENHTIVLENKPMVVRKVITQEASDLIRAYMEAVVEDGTGKKAKIEGYSIGGKSGTGQQGIRSLEQYTISFLGYFPIEQPKVAVLVVIDKPINYSDGTTTAAPVFKEAAQKIIQYYKLPSEIEIQNNEDILIENYMSKNTSEVIAQLETMPLQYQIIGIGDYVVNQFPKPNQKVSPGSTVLLYTDNIS